MKTPRQVLFERHRGAEPKLNLLRQTALATVHEEHPPGFWIAVAALLRSVRWHLAAMSAIWLFVALLNIEPKSTSSISIMAKQPASPRQLLASLRENRRQLLELLEPSVRDPLPPVVVPQRRSDLPFTNLMT